MKRINLVKMILLLFMVWATTTNSLAQSATDTLMKGKNVRYKSQGRVDFESLLIEGERKKPEMSVVTGNIGEKDSGLLKFRKDFLDVMADDFGEKIQ